MSKYTGTVQEDWFKRFIARGYKESGGMPLTDEQRRQISFHLDDIESTKRGMDALADRLEADGYGTAGSLVRDGIDYLNDISFLDFTYDLEEDEPSVDNSSDINTEVGGNVDNDG